MREGRGGGPASHLFFQGDVVGVVDEIGGRGHLAAGTQRDFAVDRLFQQKVQALARVRDDLVFLPQARQRQPAVGAALRQPA